VWNNVHKKKKTPLPPFFKNNGDKPAFQKGGFSATFSSKFKDSTLEGHARLLIVGNQLQGDKLSMKTHAHPPPRLFPTCFPLKRAPLHRRR
jgi:hypothetical protein